MHALPSGLGVRIQCGGACDVSRGYLCGRGSNGLLDVRRGDLLVQAGSGSVCAVCCGLRVFVWQRANGVSCGLYLRHRFVVVRPVCGRHVF